MAGKRTYADPCGVARALDVVGERWALLVVRELLLGPKRFTDLRTGLPHLGADVLAQRLRELEQAGVVRRRTLAPPAASKVYELTARGAGLEPVVLALGRWGSTAPFPPAHGKLSVDALAIALKTTFDPAAEPLLVARFTLNLGLQPFRAGIQHGRFTLLRGEEPEADAVITAEPAVLAAILWHARALEDALSAEEIAIEGSRRLAERFLRSFTLVEDPAASDAPAARSG